MVSELNIMPTFVEYLENTQQQVEDYTDFAVATIG